MNGIQYKVEYVHKGKFITFEGGEGGGKSTQSKLLLQSLKRAKIDVVSTREPGGTDQAEEIRRLLVTGDINKWDPITETLLHLAARRNHINNLIMPAINSGKYVICDRFSDSTVTYQGYGHQLGTKKIQQLQNAAIGSFKPDLTIILNIPTKIGILRANKRGGDENRYEKMDKEFHERVLKGFIEVAAKDPERCKLIDASSSIKDIHSQIISITNERFNLSLELSLI